ncbi:unnamed protein product, partial [Discosporangium mesarthrocarpum]
NHKNLEAEFATVEKERDDLYDTFEGAVRTVQQKSDFRQGQRLTAVEDDIERSDNQLTQIASAAKLDGSDIQHVMGGLEEVITAKNASIRDLQYSFMRAAKAYNDSLRTYSSKLAGCGVPVVEVEAMGFTPVTTATSMGPAGLVVR